jgi:Protein of unknown function (DUF2934)
MILNDIVHIALDPLITDGLVAEVHTSPHAQFVEGDRLPGEVNIVAVLTTSTPEDHRLSIESLLHDVGLGEAILHLQGPPTHRLHQIKEPADPAKIPADLAGEVEMRVRERAYLLWELEGKPDGKLDEFWDRACELIEDEAQSSYPPAQSRGHRS